MKLIIAGSRDFTNYRMLKYCVNKTIKEEKLEVTEVVSGTARGADLLGERWAAEYDIPIKRFPANWKKYGRSAGVLRNADMAEYGDFLIAFWHLTSRGTINMCANMALRRKPYRRFRFEPEN